MKDVIEKNKNLENADKVFDWNVRRDHKTVIIIQESYKYNESYLKELEEAEKLQVCVEK